MPASKTRRGYGGGAVSTKLATGLGTSDTTVQCIAGGLTTWPTGTSGAVATPVGVILNPGGDNAEKIYYGPRVGDTMQNVERGADGTTAQSHVAGETVEHVLTAQDADEANSHIADDTTDDHSQYVHNTNVRTISANHHFTGKPVFDQLGPSSPTVINASTGAVGTSKNPAHEDHTHSLDLSALAMAFAPVGVPFPFSGAVVPVGWLLCDGSAVGRTTYPQLFAALGVAWGTGDGSSTFNLPDFRTKMLVGAGTGFPFANSGGAATTTLSTAQMPPHVHGISNDSHSHTITDPGHSHHPVTQGDHSEIVLYIAGPQQNWVPALSDSAPTPNAAPVTFTYLFPSSTGITQTNPGSTNLAINPAGGTVPTGGGAAVAQPINNMPPWAAVNWILVGR